MWTIEAYRADGFRACLVATNDGDMASRMMDRLSSCDDIITVIGTYKPVGYLAMVVTVEGKASLPRILKRQAE